MLFLGGTCNNSTWREELIPKLKEAGILFFNPVVKDWTPSRQNTEKEIKALSFTIELYVITSDMIGVFSIAEAVDASNKRPGRVIFSVIPDGFNSGQLKSLEAVSNLIKDNGGIICSFSTIVETVLNIAKIEKECIDARKKRDLISKMEKDDLKNEIRRLEEMLRCRETHAIGALTGFTCARCGYSEEEWVGDRI